jgi:hypothetical protein
MLGALVGLMLAAGGCGDESDSGDGGNGHGEPASEGPGTLRISAGDVPRGDWPLMVQEGALRCEGSGGSGAVVFRAPDGADYGVNGTALGQGFPEIDPIWKKDPDIPGARINISPVLNRGLELCE